LRNGFSIACVRDGVRKPAMKRVYIIAWL